MLNFLPTFNLSELCKFIGFVGFNVKLQHFFIAGILVYSQRTSLDHCHSHHHQSSKKIWLTWAPTLPSHPWVTIIVKVTTRIFEYACCLNVSQENFNLFLKNAMCFFLMLINPSNRTIVIVDTMLWGSLDERSFQLSFVRDTFSKAYSTN